MTKLDTKNILSLNPLLTDKVRLAIVVTLSTSEDALDFKTILEQLDLSKGNLSSHMRKLEEAGFVEIHKEFLDRKPRTTYSITNSCREELKTYLETIESWLTSTQS